MNPFSATAMAGLAALSLAGCREEPQHAAEFFVFGTLVEVRVRDGEPDVAEEAFGALNQRLQSMHRDWHAWEPGALVDVNRALAEGRTARAPDDLVDLIRQAVTLEQASRGHFNPAIGGLVRMWGFHTSDYPVTGPAPGDDRIEAWLASRPSGADLRFEGDQLWSVNPSVQLDLGGIGKGRAVDVAVELLEKYGFREVLVNAGGDLRARGTPKRPWSIGIHGANGRVIGSLAIASDEAVFTSGTQERYRETDGKRFPHVLSPFTGRPVTGLRSATVLAETGTRADAAATALLVAGPQHWQAIAAAMEITQALVIDDDGSVYATEAMQRRVHWILPTDGDSGP